MAPAPITDWDDAYANAPNIPGGADFPDRWAAAAAAFRAGLGARAEIGIPYGAAPRETLDLFHPEGAAQGLVVFVHGGYWLRFDPSFWSHLAAGPLAHGWAVAMPGYTLCPESTIPGITAKIGEAIATAAARVPGPLRLAGHSAGGHLVTRMMCRDTPLPAEVTNRIARVLSLSGVHDLRPLLNTAMREPLRLDPESAAANSPALATPLTGIPLTCWVGADELPEFVRQNALLANIWTGMGVATTCIEDADKHHFDVIDGLCHADHPLTEALLG